MLRSSAPDSAATVAKPDLKLCPAKFLLSIPASFMAAVYQTSKLYGVGDIEILNVHLLGMSLSFIFSYITIYLFISTINKISFTPYVIYRVILGLFLFTI